jgi:hypothetical protein
LISHIRHTAGGPQFTNGETSFSGGLPFSDPVQQVYRQEVKKRLIKNEGFCKIFSDLAERLPECNRDTFSPKIPVDLEFMR